MKAMPRTIVLLGFMGAGKTTVGRLLAARLGMPFVDLDCEIEQAFGLPVPEIFSRHGEPEFRRVERELIVPLLAGEAKVLALGGGAFEDRDTRREVNARATGVWLDPPFEIIVDRLAGSTGRPLAAERSRDQLGRLWNQRRAAYAQAHVRVEGATAAADAVDQIVEALSRQGGRLDL